MLWRWIIVVLIILGGTWLSPFVYFYFNAKTLTKSEIDQTLIQNLQSENQNLKQLLDLKDDQKLAAKISFDSTWFSGYLSIDRGSDSGLKIGQAVTTPTGQLLGIIDSTEPNRAKVILVTNPKFQLPVMIDQQQSGILKGLYGYSAEISWIQSDGKNLDGQTVTTTGLAQNMVSGLAVGKTQNARIDKANLFYKVDVTNLANIWDSEGWVWVIKN